MGDGRPDGSEGPIRGQVGLDCVAERFKRFGSEFAVARPSTITDSATPTANTVSLATVVERVAPAFAKVTAGRPNALDVGPRLAPINALRATRSTTIRLKRGARVQSIVPSEPPPKDRPLEAMNDTAN